MFASMAKTDWNPFMSTMRTFYETKTGVAVSALRRILTLYLLTQTLSMQKGLRPSSNAIPIRGENNHVMRHPPAMPTLVA